MHLAAEARRIELKEALEGRRGEAKEQRARLQQAEAEAKAEGAPRRGRGGKAKGGKGGGGEKETDLFHPKRSEQAVGGRTL